MNLRCVKTYHKLNGKQSHAKQKLFNRFDSTFYDKVGFAGGKCKDCQGVWGMVGLLCWRV